MNRGTPTSSSSLADDGPSIGIAPPRYRLPKDVRLGQVRLQVSDLQRSIEYYEGTIGLRVRSRGEGTAVLAAFGDDTPLVELQEERGAAAVPPQGRLGLYHFAILLPDRAALGRFVAHLAERGARAGASDHLVSEALYLRDPDGLGIEVYADRPRSSWAAAGREILMDTAPLDLQAVMRAAGGEPWRGMPAGTRIGHVHLHVADLERAAGFYHAALGLDKIVWSYPGALFLSAGGYHHHLGVNTWAGPRAAQPGEGDARLLEWRMHLRAPEAAAASLREAGHAVSATDDGFLVADPWGTSLHLSRL